MKSKGLLRKLRKRSGMSLADVAERSGVARATVWKAETDAHYLVRGRTLDAILLKGFGLKESSAEYQEVVREWEACVRVGGAD